MFVIFLIPIIWFVSLPLVLQVFASIGFGIIGFFYCREYIKKKKLKQQRDKEKYGKYFKGQEQEDKNNIV